MSGTLHAKSPELPRGVTFHDFSDGGETGRLIRQKDWSLTSLGPIDTWPRSLRTYLKLIQELPTPAVIFWGKDQRQIYNDGYSAIMGSLHPQYLGSTLHECWPDFYATVYPWMKRVLENGETVKIEKPLIPLFQCGLANEAFFTFSFSPLYDDHGAIAGVLQLVTEVTETALSGRRAGVLYELARQAAQARDTEGAVSVATEILGRYANDLPFFLTYLIDPEGRMKLLRLGCKGLPADQTVFPGEIDLGAGDQASIPEIAQAFHKKRATPIKELTSRFGALPGGPWPKQPKVAIACPVISPDQQSAIGVLVAGISPYLVFDDRYRQFLELVSAQLASMVAAAQAYESEQKRAEALAEINRARTALFANVSGINQMLLQALNCSTEEELGTNCLAILQEVTHSKSGFIGEINAEGKLEDIAVSNPARDACTRPDKKGCRSLPIGLKAHGLYGRVLLDGKGFFANGLAAYPDRIGLPAGYPPVTSFLGVPLIHKGKIIGMIGLGDREGGYREEDVRTVQAMSHSVVQVFIHQRSQQALQESQEQYRRLFNSIGEGFCIIEKVPAKAGEPPDFRYIEANPAFAAHSGVSDVVGKTVRQAFPGEAESWLRIYDTVLTTGEAILFEKELAALGRRLELYAFRVEDKTNRRVAVIFRDVSERRRLEELQLRQSEDRFQKMFNDSPVMISIVRMADDKYVEVNRKFLEILEYTKEEVLGHTPLELNIREMTSLRPVLDKLNENGVIQNTEFDMRAKTGGMIRVVASIAIIMFNGEPCRIATMQDITKEKQMESELLRLDRLNTVGEMAAAIGHEVRNPLTTVRGYLQMYLRKAESAQYREQFKTMIDELDRANFIISGFLSLAKNKALEFKRHNLNDIISTLLPLVQSEAYRTGHDIQVEMGDIPDIDIDEKEIRQLLLNIIRNGFEAMEPSGRLTIQTCAEQDRVILTVRDTGSGIPPEVLNKIGTPFTTTKENGTGLGLPVCYRIAERHGAKIEVDTSRQGTAFVVSFPL
ncbi:MAG: GAF domain-containing protein [Negativicutes bacterium]|nr:GAF domain-containing protein [Negativicutes bacterium]